MKQPIKMTPGDELHLTTLMAPFSLNLVTGQDRQHLLSYGRAAFEAGHAQLRASTPEAAEDLIEKIIERISDHAIKVVSHHDARQNGNPEQIESARQAVFQAEDWIKRDLRILAARPASNSGANTCLHQIQEPTVNQQLTNDRDSHFFLAGWNGARQEVDANNHFKNAYKSAPVQAAQTEGSVSNATLEVAPAAVAEQALLKVLHAIQRYMPPDGVSDRETLSEIIGIVDPWPLGDVPAAVAVPDERAAFEAWAVTHYAEVNLAREGDGYRYALAKDWWPVWQARAALAATNEGKR